MSRSNPSKRKRSACSTSLLAYGEGDTEKAFLRFLKNLYNRGTGVAVTVDHAGGKDPFYIITKAVAIKNLGRHTKTFILLDTDKKWSLKVKKFAVDNQIELIGSKPCIEGLLINIIEPKTYIAGWPSKKCKSYFESKYLNEHNKLNSEKYQPYFPKALLDKRRLDKKNVNCATLNKLILFLENKAF